MKPRNSGLGVSLHASKWVVPAIVAAMLPACANYAGIHSDKQIAEPQQFETAKSLPAEQGHWPAADWVDQFGDAQLKTLIDETPTSSASPLRISTRR